MIATIMSQSMEQKVSLLIRKNANSKLARIYLNVKRDLILL